MAGVSSLVFAIRNGKKAVRGDYGRYGVVAAQAANVTNAAADSSVKFISKGAQRVLSSVDNIGESVFKVADASSKIAKITSKAVNPLLIGAAGIRVLRDEDKKSRAIEEGTALSLMFLGEGIYKRARNTINQNLGKTLKEGQKVIKNEAIASKLKIVAEKIKEFTQNSTGKQKVLFVLAELAFVAVSICCYDLGKKLGTKITGRDMATASNVKGKKNKTEDVNSQKTKNVSPEEQIANITKTQAINEASDLQSEEQIANLQNMIKANTTQVINGTDNVQYGAEAASLQNIMAGIHSEGSLAGTTSMEEFRPTVSSMQNGISYNNFSPMGQPQYMSNYVQNPNGFEMLA